MKQLDKLLLKSFLTSFALVFFIVVFILLNRQMLFYYDDIIGKGLSWIILCQFIFYFAVFMLPHALPLTILLSSLICFGGLAEHQELTAIKAGGISPLRALLPIALFVGMLTIVAFYVNDTIVPRMALRAYSLLYDIKQKKPALDLREGVFYSGLPHVSIKVNKKFSDDDAALKDILLYDHKPSGRVEVWVADSGRMYSIHDDQYLKFELYRGYRYEEGGNDQVSVEHKSAPNSMSRTAFNKTEFVFDLASFSMMKTDPKLFGNNKMMMDRSDLQIAIDSVTRRIERDRKETRDALDLSTLSASAVDRARTSMTKLEKMNEARRELEVERASYQAQRIRIITNSIACLTLFFIGAPLGLLIRKGGIGMPVLVSIVFFLLFFVLDMQAEKFSKRFPDLTTYVMWLGNIILSMLGFYFLWKCRQDSQLSEGAPSLPRLRTYLQKLLSRFALA